MTADSFKLFKGVLSRKMSYLLYVSELNTSSTFQKYIFLNYAAKTASYEISMVIITTQGCQCVHLLYSGTFFVCFVQKGFYLIMG